MVNIKVNDIVSIDNPGYVYSSYDTMLDIMKLDKETRGKWRNDGAPKKGQIGIIAAISKHGDKCHDETLAAVETKDNLYIMDVRALSLIQATADGPADNIADTIRREVLRLKG